NRKGPRWPPPRPSQWDRLSRENRHQRVGEGPPRPPRRRSPPDLDCPGKAGAREWGRPSTAPSRPLPPRTRLRRQSRRPDRVHGAQSSFSMNPTPRFLRNLKAEPRSRLSLTGGEAWLDISPRARCSLIAREGPVAARSLFVYAAVVRRAFLGGRH